MAYTSFSFPPSTPVFPRAPVVLKYLESYAAHFNLNAHIRLGTSVQSASYSELKWHVELSSGESVNFDSIIVCNGHYRKPRYPDTPGLADWLKRKKASHSAWYRRPENMGATVMVVGAGPSGLDISAEMCGCAKSVILSVTGATSEDTGNLKRRGRVVRYNEDSSVVFEDGSTEDNIDHCLLATGYEMSFPFLSQDSLTLDVPPPIPPLPRDLYNSTYHVFPLAKQIFPIQAHYPPSSLAFLGLLVRVAPFPLLEAQARAVQETVDIVARYARLKHSSGSDDPMAIAHEWHRFVENEQFDYRDAMYRFAGELIIVPDWEKEMYENKAVLRKVWIDIEKSGEADEWVKDVGKNGLQEWVDLLKRLLAKGRDAETRMRKL
ncbi:FAD/NAD(P)-binding domain-containing protein [Hymenopellis radicata]|nr:FAD/NAD(P)-binding domain-containing protein [Hymenopellis radicata]